MVTQKEDYEQLGTGSLVLRLTDWQALLAAAGCYCCLRGKGRQQRKKKETTTFSPIKAGHAIMVHQ